MKNIFDNAAIKRRILHFIKSHGGIASSVTLVSVLLKIHCSDERSATKIISSFLARDRRFVYREAAGWTISDSPDKQLRLDDLPFVIFSARIGQSGRLNGRICEVSFIKIKKMKEESSFHLTAPPDHGKQKGISISAARQILSFIQETVIVFFEPHSIFRQLMIEAGNKTGTFPDNEYLSLKKIMGSLFGLKRNASLEDAASVLSISPLSGDSARMRAGCTTELFLILLENLTEAGMETLTELKELEAEKGEEVDFSIFDFDESFIDSIPETPGVYRFLDDEGTPLYIGKAKNLKQRVSSYFLTFRKKPPKLIALHRSLRRIEYEQTGSELEAILRESELLRLLRPPMNRQFEVHERMARYGKSGDLIIVLPGRPETDATLYFIRNGKLLKTFSVRHSEKKFKEIGDLLRTAYFSRKKSSPRKARSGEQGEEMDVSIELIASYLERNRDAMRWFDPTDYEGPSDVIRIIRSYLRSLPDERERIILR